MSETSPIPFYTPVQPKTNTCSHCWFTPRHSRYTVSFYTYPCGKQHLAHQKCFQTYSKAPITPCRMCQREFGTVDIHLHKNSRIEVINPISSSSSSPSPSSPSLSSPSPSSPNRSKKVYIFLAISVLIILGIFIGLLFFRKN
jgi:hypothetical protein